MKSSSKDNPLKGLVTRKKGKKCRTRQKLADNETAKAEDKQRRWAASAFLGLGAGVGTGVNSVILAKKLGETGDSKAEASYQMLQNNLKKSYEAARGPSQGRMGKLRAWLVDAALRKANIPSVDGSPDFSMFGKPMRDLVTKVPTKKLIAAGLASGAVIAVPTAVASNLALKALEDKVDNDYKTGKRTTTPKAS